MYKNGLKYYFYFRKNCSWNVRKGIVRRNQRGKVQDQSVKELHKIRKRNGPGTTKAVLILVRESVRINFLPGM